MGGNQADHAKDPPLIDQEFFEGPPSTTWCSFKEPRLRQFPRRSAEIEWHEFLGMGIQGAAFKVSIGGESPVVIKVFLHTNRPKPVITLPHMSWPFKDECRTVALLEKMKWAMECANANSNETIRIKRGPQTVNDALHNIRAFSDEYRRLEESQASEDYTNPPPFPPLPRCYGWTKVSFSAIPLRRMRAFLEFHPDDRGDLYAIIYEFVPPKEQDRSVAQVHLDFFYAVGFQVHPYKLDNWHGGRLIDQSDIWSVYQRAAWNGKYNQHKDAKVWMWTLSCEPRNIPENREKHKLPTRPSLPTGRFIEEVLSKGDSSMSQSESYESSEEESSQSDDPSPKKRKMLKGPVVPKPSGFRKTRYSNNHPSTSSTKSGIKPPTIIPVPKKKETRSSSVIPKRFRVRTQSDDLSSSPSLSSSTKTEGSDSSSEDENPQHTKNPRPPVILRPWVPPNRNKTKTSKAHKKPVIPKPPVPSRTGNASETLSRFNNSESSTE